MSRRYSFTLVTNKPSLKLRLLSKPLRKLKSHSLPVPRLFKPMLKFSPTIHQSVTTASPRFLKLRRLQSNPFHFFINLQQMSLVLSVHLQQQNTIKFVNCPINSPPVKLLPNPTKQKNSSVFAQNL